MVWHKRLTFKGKKHKPETIEKMTGKNNPMFGRKHTQETKDKISVKKLGITSWNLGINMSDISKEKDRLAHLGKKHSINAKQKMSISRKGRGFTSKHKRNLGLAKIGENNSMWRDDDVGYCALHEWVRNNLSEPELCQMCNKVPPYDLANITGVYSRDLKNWAYYCRKCHMVSDGRLDRLHKVRKSD